MYVYSATRRRIALTGSPLQNNLEEYYCMVNWVRPRFLGTIKEFRRRFLDVIKAGESKDATRYQVQAMKRRAHVLHKMLRPIIDRKDLTELSKYLKPKREFVVSLAMTPSQRLLYREFLGKLNQTDSSSRGTRLFKAYQVLLRLWNHPACTMMMSHSIELKAYKDWQDRFRSSGKASARNNSNSNSGKAKTEEFDINKPPAKVAPMSLELIGREVTLVRCHSRRCPRWKKAQLIFPLRRRQGQEEVVCGRLTKET
jgi:transcriptional regulator ATRX